MSDAKKDGGQTALVADESVALAAYRDLMNGPLPTCDKDFRRAIMLAVLIGRQIEADQRGPEQKSP